MNSKISYLRHVNIIFKFKYFTTANPKHNSRFTFEHKAPIKSMAKGNTIHFHGV